MEFEVLAKCHTTRARVSRMKLARMSGLYLSPILEPKTASDGVTMLPTFMPVATQAAIKGLTSEQVESLGVTLILNNTYHLNLRPGLKVLNEAGGAHRFQGWNRNLLTVCIRIINQKVFIIIYAGQWRLPTGVAEQIHYHNGRGCAFRESVYRRTHNVNCQYLPATDSLYRQT